MRQAALEPAALWKILAALQGMLSLWLIQATQDSLSATLLAVVVWGGAAICLEGDLMALQVRPSRYSLVAGLILLGYASWRSAMVFGLDSSVYVLAPLQGLAIALLARPMRQIFMFRDSLAVLILLPLQLVLSRLLPEYWLSVVTGRVSQSILIVFGINASLSGRVLNLGERGVSIGGSCSGLDTIGQLIVVAIVFVLAFPIRGVAGKLLYVVSAPCIALFVNSCRISLLAVINASAIPMREQLFDFMHEQWGGLLFGGVGTLVIGQIYMGMINRQLGDHHG